MWCLRFAMLVLWSILIALLTNQTVVAGVIDNEVHDDGPEYHMIQGVKVYKGDRQCILVGGLCVHKDDCNEPTTTKGLCPSNAHRDIECCYELPLKPAPCAQYSGECMKDCNKMLTRPGTDCEDGHVCCTLI